eukprot:SAG31_NODE_16499_length_707_cov_0.631579_1_plen_64_part_10
MRAFLLPKMRLSFFLLCAGATVGAAIEPTQLIPSPSFSSSKLSATGDADGMALSTQQLNASFPR